MSVPQSVPPKRTSAAARSLVMMDEITGTPSRVNRGEAEVHTPDRASSSGHASSLIPTPVRNSIARVEPKESDPHFDHEKTDKGGVVYNVYIFLQKKSRPSLLWTNQVLQHGISTPLPAIPTGCVRTPSGSGLHRNFLPTWH